MIRLLLLFCLFTKTPLFSVEFVLFTQPKTATHLLIPILNELTGKNVYWAKEYTTNASPFKESYSLSSQNPENYFFSLENMPWDLQTMNLVWRTNKKNGTFLHLHAPYSATMEKYLVKKNCINFFVKRDPRDQIVSLLNHYKYLQFNEKSVELMSTDDERLLFMIKNKSRSHTLHYMEWIKSPLCCVLDFEKLMGTHGGAATHAEAIEEVRKIAIALQLDLSDSYLESVYEKCFGKGWSFFRGKVGAWKDYFKPEHTLAIKNEIGELLIELGYEHDLDW